MRRITTAREQHEMLAPWRQAARPGIRLPRTKADYLDSIGLTQDKLKHNYYSWLDSLTPEQIATGGLWYPVGHDWGEHVGRRTGLHPLKVHSLVSATSPRRLWISQNLGRQSNLGDAYLIATNPPGAVPKLGGLSGKSNLDKANRIRAAAEDPDSIMEAFLGHFPATGKPKRPRDTPKTHDFVTTLHDPETGGAFNYMAQPAVGDVWATLSCLFSRDQWDRADTLRRRNGGLIVDYLKYPGKGEDEGLGKFVLNKKTGEWEEPPLSEVAARVVDRGGGYDRVRNAMRAGAARHQLPFAHIGQAAVWGEISKNPTPTGQPNPDVDLDSIEHPEELYHELWARRASGLVAPRDPGGLILPNHYDGDEEGR
jgi:hypothetical protein